MKNLLINLLFVFGFIYSGVSFSANVLSDTVLAGVSGGGLDSSFESQNLTQDQQQPEQNSFDNTLFQPLQHYDGMELTPELFSVLQSSINAKRERKLLLSGLTQLNARALNLENLLSSDSIASNNIFNGAGLTLDAVSTGVEVNQLNDLSQLHRGQGYFDSSISTYGFEQTVERRSGNESFDYYVYSSVYQQREKELWRKGGSYNFTEIGETLTSLDDIANFNPPITIIDELESEKSFFDLDPVGYILDTKVIGEYGVKLDYTGLTIKGIGVDLNSIKTSGYYDENLLLDTTIILPELDFGSIDFDGCLGACIESSFSLGSIGGTGEQLDIIIPDLGPKIEELNLGAGFALSGVSSTTNFDPGNFTISGDAYFKATPKITLVLDLSKLEWGEIKIGEKLKSWGVFGGDAKIGDTWSFDLFNSEIDFDLLNEEFEVDRFNTVPGVETSWFTEEVDESNKNIEIYKYHDVADSSINEFFDHNLFVGGQMTGAQAELLALSESSLSVDRSSTILLTQSAQKNMQVFNGVNAVSSIAANALNISQLPILTGGLLAVPRTSLQQQNLIVQHR